MNGFVPLVTVAIALSSQAAFAKNRLTDPIKIARECKNEAEQFCSGLRPGGQRVVGCLKDKALQLSPACLSAVQSTGAAK